MDIIEEPLERYLKGDNIEIYNIARKIIPNGTIAGGAARQIFFNDKLGSTDIDFYFRNFNQLLFIHNSLYQYKNRKHVSHKSISYTINDTKYQLVKHHYYPTIEDLFNEYDFHCCMFAIKNDRIYYTKQAVEDTINKVINVHYSKSKNLKARIGKYISKGYVPNCGVALGIFGEYIKYVSTIKFIGPAASKDNFDSLFREFFGVYNY